MFFRPYVAPANANWKQRSCAEFDQALVKLHQAMDGFFEAGFNLDHAVNDAAELVEDDPETYGRRAEDITGDPGILDRIKLMECSPVPGDTTMLGSVFFHLHDMLDARFNNIQLAAPQEVPDNDEAQVITQTVTTFDPWFGIVCAHISGLDTSGGDCGSEE